MNTTALGLSPSFPCDKTVFMGTEGHGVFRTTQGDQPDPVWLAVNNGIGDPGILSLAVSPNYGRCDRIGTGDKTVFVGTRSGLIYRTDNGGTTWTLTNGGLPTVGSPATYAIAAIATSPNYASDRTVMAALQSIVAGGPDAVYRTTDGGNTWLPFDAGLTDRSVQAFALSANFANDFTMFLGTRFSGVYRVAGKLSNPTNPSSQPSPTPIATPAASPTPASGPRTAGASTGSLEPDDATVQAVRVPYPSLSLVARAAGALDGQVGYGVPGPVVINITVENNGNVPLLDIVVRDGGKHDFCGDNPDTGDVDESKDDFTIARIAALAPGEKRDLAATFLMRPEDPNSTSTLFNRIRRAECAIGLDAVSSPPPDEASPVVVQDDVVVQLVQWESVTKSNSEMTDLWIWSFAVSPFFANDQTVFAGSAYGGLFKSNSAGSANTTWTRVNPGLEPEWVSVRSIVMSPRYPLDRTVYVGTERGIYRGVEQSDGSMTWNPLNRGFTRSLDVRSLHISPDFGFDGALYAGTWGGEVYRLHYTPEPTWIPQRRAVNGLWAWAVDLTPSGVLFAGTWGGSPFWPGILGRNNLQAGTGWEFPPLPGLPGGELTTFAVAKKPGPTGHTVFAGSWDRGLFRSDDSGGSWINVNLPTAQPVRSVSLSANYETDRTFYVATWGTGIYRSFDGGATWGQLNAGLADHRIRSVAMSPTYASDGLVFAGSDSEGVLRWHPTDNRWYTVNSGMPNTRVMSIAVSPDFATDRRVLAATWGGGVAVSDNRGDSWSAPNGGLNSLYTRFVTLSPSFAADGQAYVGTTAGVYRSNDRGSSWGTLGDPNGDVGTVDVTGLAVSPGSPRTVFASTGGRGVWQYTEGGGIASVAPGPLDGLMQSAKALIGLR